MTAARLTAADSLVVGLLAVVLNVLGYPLLERLDDLHVLSGIRGAHRLGQKSHDLLEYVADIRAGMVPLASHCYEDEVDAPPDDFDVDLSDLAASSSVIWLGLLDGVPVLDGVVGSPSASLGARPPVARAGVCFLGRWLDFLGRRLVGYYWHRVRAGMYLVAEGAHLVGDDL